MRRTVPAWRLRLAAVGVLTCLSMPIGAGHGDAGVAGASLDFARDRKAPALRDMARQATPLHPGTLAPEAPTFAAVAPIIFEACASCHRAGGPAPFSLTTFLDVRRRASQIVAVTRSHFMPPWKVEPGIGHFVGQRQLSAAEIELIDTWSRAGAPEGDPRETPALPPAAEGWLLGTPDMIVTVPDAFTLQADPSDTFRIFAIPLPVTKLTYVRGIEFNPGNTRVVHHANIRVDRGPTTRQLDTADPLPGYDGLMPRTAEYPDGHFLGWTPGQVAPLVAPDLAWTLYPGSDLVVQLHMQPSGAVERVQPVIGLYFSATPPTRTPTILRLGSQGIDIAPGEARHVIRDAYKLPVDVDLLAIQPHAHYRAREIRGTATFPDGTTRLLMHIKDWDFRWQHVYRLVDPLPLPNGTTLAMEYTYDNSAENVRNPQLPPARVWWGQRSRDEMGDLWFQLLAKSDGDRALLGGRIIEKMTLEDVVGYETMLRVTPDDSELHDDVAVMYLGLGRPEDAVRHFRISAEQQPQSAPARFNFGTALAAAGRLDEAVTAFKEALERRPDYAPAHNNMGRVLLAQNKVSEALPHALEAVRLDPKNPQAQFNLSAVAAAAGLWEQAASAANAALALSPPESLAAQIRVLRDHYQRQVKQ